MLLIEQSVQVVVSLDGFLTKALHEFDAHLHVKILTLLLLSRAYYALSKVVKHSSELMHSLRIHNSVKLTALVVKYFLQHINMHRFRIHLLL